MSEAWFVNTVFSVGVTPWQNQRDVLPGNKAACLASREENSTLNEDLQSKLKHSEQKHAGNILCLFVSSFLRDMRSLSLSMS